LKAARAKWRRRPKGLEPPPLRKNEQGQLFDLPLFSLRKLLLMEKQRYWEYTREEEMRDTDLSMIDKRVQE